MDKPDGLQEVIDALTALHLAGGQLFGYEITPILDGMRGRRVTFRADVYMPIEWRPRL